MNVETGHVISGDEFERMRRDHDETRRRLADHYQPVPTRHAAAAEAALQSGGYVDMAGKSALAAWALKRRTKEKRRRKLAKASRRANRSRGR